MDAWTCPSSCYRVGDRSSRCGIECSETEDWELGDRGEDFGDSRDDLGCCWGRSHRTCFSAQHERRIAECAAYFIGVGDPHLPHYTVQTHQTTHSDFSSKEYNPPSLPLWTALRPTPHVSSHPSTPSRSLHRHDQALPSNPYRSRSSQPLFPRKR